MNFIKEVNYVFEFMGETFTESHYVDDLTQRRYRWPNPSGRGSYPMALNFKGTGDAFKTIHPPLKGSNMIYDDNGNQLYVLLFDLEDVEQEAIVLFEKSVRGGSTFYNWIFNNDVYKAKLV